MSAEEDTLDDLLRALSLAEHDCAVYRYTDGLQVYEEDVYRARLQAVADARAAIRAHVAVSAGLREIAALIARDSLPVTASSTTYFVPRYQIYKLRAALESQSAEGEPYGYLREVDGRAELSVGPARPADRAGGYATPWCQIYTRPQPAPEQPAAQWDGVPAPRDAHFGGNSYEASLLRNLLAVIHGDGGHYVAEHGIDKATEDAETKVAAALQRQQADADRVDAFVRAFVAGAKWWEFEKTGATMWQSDQDRAAAAARWKLDNPAPQPPEDDAAIDSARAEGGGRER